MRLQETLQYYLCASNDTVLQISWFYESRNFSYVNLVYVLSHKYGPCDRTRIAVATLRIPQYPQLNGDDRAPLFKACAAVNLE